MRSASWMARMLATVEPTLVRTCGTHCADQIPLCNLSVHTDVAVAAGRRIPAIRQPDAFRKVSVIPEPDAAVRPNFPQSDPRPMDADRIVRPPLANSCQIGLLRPRVHFVLPCAESS